MNYSVLRLCSLIENSHAEPFASVVSVVFDYFSPLGFFCAKVAKGITLNSECHISLGGHDLETSCLIHFKM